MASTQLVTSALPGVTPSNSIQKPAKEGLMPKRKTLERVLVTICDANATLTFAASALLKRVEEAVGNLRRLTTDKQNAAFFESKGSMAFAVVTAIASIGKAIAIDKMSQGICKTASVLTQQGGNVFSNIERAHQDKIEMQRTITQTVLLQGAQEVHSHLERQRDTLNQSANSLLNTHQRASGG
jgi:hypothetical protein